MSFVDYGTVEELSLRSHISIKDDDGNWVKGKVIELSLLGDDMVNRRITLQTGDNTVITLDRAPKTTTILEWD
jgi:hypothetical protein